MLKIYHVEGLFIEKKKYSLHPIENPDKQLHSNKEWNHTLFKLTLIDVAISTHHYIYNVVAFLHA